MKKSKYLTDQYHTSSWFEPGGWQELSLVGAAIKNDLFVALARADADAGGLASALSLDERALESVLEALVELGYVENVSDRYALTDAARERFGDPEGPGYLGWAVLHSWRLIERWLTLPELMKTGKPRRGDRFSETVEGFIRAMDVYAAATAEEVVEVCLKHRPQAKTVLDVGGATGTVSKVFTEQGVTATLFDLPGAIEVVRAEIESDHPAVNLIGGDFNKSLPAGPFDIIYLGNVTHIYGPEMNQTLFARVAASLEPGGLLAILDFMRGRSTSAALFGINMLVNTTSGGTWTEPQYYDWLSASGFSEVEFLDTQSRDQQLVLARRAD